jgi:hypothetical protein
MKLDSFPRSQVVLGSQKKFLILSLNGGLLGDVLTFTVIYFFKADSDYYFKIFFPPKICTH